MNVDEQPGRALQRGQATVRYRAGAEGLQGRSYLSLAIGNW